MGGWADLFPLLHLLQADWPESAQPVFLILAIGIGVVLTVLFAVVFKSRDFAELRPLHVPCAAGFEWMMPVLFTK